MITKFYWIFRILGYLVSLGGIFLYLGHKADADPASSQFGLGMVGIGFLAFFVSYALRAWLRFGSRRQTDETRIP
jgi:hypothetical protein